ncbi:unannotated protein [freshwater metagenome]|uniref:glycerol kinase n=1 Tax=freshwater metagenome TaxID=449393 RepID=A0A6J7HDM2_9ZZZZ|nr:glycerol kinase GlpK [Actinomycetota bacterium]
MILAIDQGTTGSTCLLVDGEAGVLGRATREIEQHFPQPGWVEHDLRDLWEVTRAVALEALADAGAGPGDVRAIGITNQRETACAWDPQTGEPLHRAIVWQDRRTAGRCDDLRAGGLAPIVRERTGLVLDPYFSATKFEWLLTHVDGLRDRVAQGRAVLGTVDSWLAWNLTGEHVTDPSNASRTMLYDLHEGTWSVELCDRLGIPIRGLAVVRPSIGESGRVQPGALPGHEGVPVTAIAGDQQASLYGQACLDPGMGKATFGTGVFALVNTGDAVPPVPKGLLATVAWSIGQRRTYALEASIFAGGAAVQWLRDGLGIISEAGETDALARSLSGNDGVYLVPAFAGLGSPHWDPYARGTIVGLTRGTGPAHLARATLEAIAYQTVDAVRAIETASGTPLRVLKADGGACANRWLMQFQADVLGVPVVVPEVLDTTALGVALMAGVGAGMWTQQQVGELWHERERFEPAMAADERAALLAGWGRALERSRSWAE